MSCTLGISHVPKAPASDFHHVIPQAWQRFWQPPPITGPEGISMVLAAAGQLWDARTVELCPNHHRLVHEAIVAMMRDHAKPGRGKIWATARLALDRYTAAGGDLDALRAAGEYGQQ
jgi:hypothetical protein